MSYENIAERGTYPQSAYWPIFRHEKERLKRMNEPRAWEYEIFTKEELARNRARLEGRYPEEKPVEINITAGGLLMLAFLELLNSLSNPKESAIERQE
jgi:hypothetical protein